MNLNTVDIQQDHNFQLVAAQARHLMSVRRQRIQHRKQAMLSRAAAELGIEA